MSDIAWSERAVIAALLKSEELETTLTASDFVDSLHRKTFEAIQTLRAKGEAIDIIDVIEMVGNRVMDIDAILNQTPTVNAEHHAEIVRDNARKRQAIAVLQDTLRELNTPTKRYEEVIPSTQGMLEQIGGHGGDYLSLDDALQAAAVDMATARAVRDRGEFLGLNTGLGALNLMTDGLQPGQMVVLAGRPSTGKTALALQMALAANEPVGIVSLEMGAKSLSTRILAGHSGEDYRGLRRGMVYDLEPLMAGLKGRPVWLDEHTHDIAAIVGRLAQWKRRHGIRLAVIDYLGLIEGGNGNTRNEQVADISRQLKKASMHLGITVLCLSQLNRMAADKRPELYQLRDSGAIEQDADIVIALHAENLDAIPRVVDLGVLKNREGMVGWMGSAPGEHWRFTFDGMTQRFTEMRS